MKEMTEQIGNVDTVIGSLNEIQGDITVPKNVRIKIEIIINILKEDIELSIRINKVLNGLDEIANDANMQPYTRTQIWNIMSLLEKL